MRFITLGVTALFSRNALPIIDQSIFSTGPSPLISQTFINLFTIRFIPGLRTVGYTLSGYVALPLRLFTAAVLMATALWTVVVFFAIYQLGSQAWFQASEYRWWWLCLLVVLLLVFNRVFSAKMIKETA